MSGILLPNIRSVSLVGFQPLFDDTVELALPHGPFLILGGNAMGKTTTLQAVVYGLAGEADDEVEPDKHARVTARYFRQRLNDNQETEIRVGFEIGDAKIIVRRGINSDEIRGVKINGENWIHDNNEAIQRYEEAVIQSGGYQSFADFRFLLHRLAYLPETRQSLVWDQRAQVRVVMLVCADAIREGKFRLLSKQLREIDTDKRHLHVDIGHLQDRIDRFEATESQRLRTASKPAADANVLEALNEIQAYQKDLEEITIRRSNVLAQAEQIRTALVKTNELLETLQEKLTTTEDSFILNTLRAVEANTPAVALQKLLVYHLCPYCSQKSDELAKEAHKALSDGNCPVCKQSYKSEVIDGDVAQLRRSVSDANKERDTIDQQYRACHVELGIIADKEFQIRSRMEKIAGKLPRVPKEEEFKFDTSNLPALRRTIEAYRKRHSKLERDWQALKRRVDAEFAEFTESCSIRIARLKKAASDYGRAFLGDSSKCEFVAVPARGELGDVTYFVPYFSEKERTSPETCSESERFFLDIGFRMALLELTGALTNSVSTFLCETPENALDLAYTDNVAAMFARFARQGFSLFLTANIQPGGVAKPLLAPYPKVERQKRIFNLLRAGYMTDVQKNKLVEFDAQMKDLLGGRMHG